jgi:uncharacterized protein
VRLLLTKQEDNRYNKICLFEVIRLIIQIRDLAGKDIEINKQLNLSELLTSRKDVAAAEPVEVSLTATAAEDTVKVHGQCSTAVELICARCLSHFTEKLELPIEEIFTQKREVAEADDEDQIHLITSDKIDLQPYVEENVVLGLPFIPLCKEECQGLCPVCGQNKNEQPCDCDKQEKIDPRLAGLKAFFD